MHEEAIKRPCKRCRKRAVLMAEFVSGLGIEQIKAKYGKVCPNCLNAQEKDEIVNKQVDILLDLYRCSDDMEMRATQIKLVRKEFFNE